MSKFRALIVMAALAMILGLSSPAGAEECILSTADAGSDTCSGAADPGTVPKVDDEVEVKSGGSTDPAPRVVTPTGKATLPVTGVETLILAGMGSGLIAAGGLMVLRSRQSASA